MAAEVRAKVLELYQHQDVAVKHAADAALQEFQKTDLAWSIGQELVVDTDPSVQFFGAQTLYSKVQLVTKGTDTSSSVDMQALVPVFQNLLASPALGQPAKQRLVLAVAAIAVHLSTSSWTNAVLDILSLASTQPQHAWAVLLAIPERLSEVAYTYLKTDRRTEALLRSSGALLDAAAQLSPTCAEEAVTGTISDSPFSLAMQSLRQWSRVVGLQIVSHQAFAQHLVVLLQGPAFSSEIVTDVVLEVLRSSDGVCATYNGTGVRGPAPLLQPFLSAVVESIGKLLPVIQRQAKAPATTLGEADAQCVARWGQVAYTLVECYTQVLWLEAGVAEMLVSFIGSCFVAHPNSAQSVAELWALFKDMRRDDKLPPGVLPGILQRLTGPCIASFLRFGRFDSPYVDDVAEHQQVRSAQQDILSDMYVLAASDDVNNPEATQIIAVLLSSLKEAEVAKDWHGVEVALYALVGIAEALAFEPAMPCAFHEVLQVACRTEAPTEDQCATIATLLRTCGPQFERALVPHLAPAVQRLMVMVPRIPLAASDAVLEICGYAGQHLLQHLGEFLQAVATSAPTAPTAVDASLHGALVGVVRTLPAEQAVAAFNQICEGTSVMMAGGFDISQDAGRERLHRCTCRLLKCTLVMREHADGPASSPGQPLTPAVQAAAAGLTGVLLTHWGNVAAACQGVLCAAPVPKDAAKGKPIYEYSDTAVQVNCLALLRYAARSANEAPARGEELSTRLVELAAACIAQGQFAPLTAVALLATQQDFARQGLLPLLDGLCPAVQSHIQAGRPEQALAPVLEFFSSLAANVGSALSESQHFPTVMQFCLAVVRTTDTDLLKPALVFLLKYLMARPPLHAAEIVEAVMLHFHAWPRSVSSDTYRLLMACVERHAALYLPMAASPTLPCLLALPPAEQAMARAALQKLRGPRFRAFLVDLGNAARGEASADLLGAYVVDGAA